jgi:hypothetical protein
MTRGGRGGTSQTHLRILAARFARVLLFTSRPLIQRAQGMPGAGAPAAARGVVVNTRVSHHGHTGNTRRSPRNGFNGFLRAPRRPGSLATVTPEKLASQELDASVGASGPHDFAVRLMPFVSRHQAPPHPASYVRDDRETPLCVGARRREFSLIWVKRRRELFLRQGVDRREGRGGFCWLICPSGRVLASQE